MAFRDNGVFAQIGNGGGPRAVLFIPHIFALLSHIFALLSHIFSHSFSHVSDISSHIFSQVSDVPSQISSGEPLFAPAGPVFPIYVLARINF